MEKRTGTITIFIAAKDSISQINALLSEYAFLILARQGLPFRDISLNIISLIVQGNPNDINALTGKLGRIANVEAKAILSKTIKIKN